MVAGTPNLVTQVVRMTSVQAAAFMFGSGATSNHLLIWRTGGGGQGAYTKSMCMWEKCCWGIGLDMAHMQAWQ